ncbi:MAG: TerC family protein [Planctomycetota bacterium]|jgi:predicted tellurium resistance membrane protein TerC|nr:TerC family protein [Planctomycetota bacterium]MDP6763508.1 TerC family protein [Planctomycetota bacterium]MDP6990805.1 TerC family protein [Planctomycetota bacterium]
MDQILTSENLIALCTLTLLEIVLGIDNVVFLSILASRLPEERRAAARRIGLALAMLMRIVLLLALSWVMKLTAPLFVVIGHEISGRDLILLTGGLFLIGKATFEIHHKLEGEGPHATEGETATFGSVLLQVIILDAIFSLDSVITAVGMADALWVMITAVIAAVAVMMIFAGAIGEFIERHPTMKMLALAFLILIGVMLFAEGLGKHIEKGYIYFAMAFSLVVEILNLRVRAKRAARST